MVQMETWFGSVLREVDDCPFYEARRGKSHRKFRNKAVIGMIFECTVTFQAFLMAIFDIFHGLH